MSYETLLGIIQEARDIEADENSRPPAECPNDFTALREGPDGILFCPWDGWQYPRDA